MSSRWDAEYDRHQQEQRLLNPRRTSRGKPRAIASPGTVEDYEPEQHLRWPEARKINPDNAPDDC